MGKLMYGEEVMNPNITIVEGEEKEEFVTQSEYDALPDSKLTNNIVYYIN